MASSGIRDQVAIIGMGCTRFGELWDKGVDDLLTDAATEAAASAGMSHPRHRRLLARHHDLGRVRRDPVAAVEARLQARDPGRELLRHGLRGLPQRLLRRGLGRLRHGHGHRRREAQGHRLFGPDRHPRRGRRHRPRSLVAGRLLVPRSVLLPQVRRGQGPDEGGHEPDRLQEPPERRRATRGPSSRRKSPWRRSPRRRWWPATWACSTAAG